MLEAEVKDARFSDGWAFFDLGGQRSSKNLRSHCLETGSLAVLSVTHGTPLSNAPSCSFIRRSTRLPDVWGR